MHRQIALNLTLIFFRVINNHVKSLLADHLPDKLESLSNTSMSVNNLTDGLNSQNRLISLLLLEPVEALQLNLYLGSPTSLAL